MSSGRRPRVERDLPGPDRSTGPPESGSRRSGSGSGSWATRKDYHVLLSFIWLLIGARKRAEKG